MIIEEPVDGRNSPAVDETFPWMAPGKHPADLRPAIHLHVARVRRWRTRWNRKRAAKKGGTP